MNLYFRRQTDRTEPQRKRMRKGMYLLPSLFTVGNIAAGYYAIVQALQGTAVDFWHFDYAAKAIGIAVVLDGLDGRIARMTNTTSDFGRELDSLADVITFGVAPAVLAWMWGFHLLPSAISVPAWVELDSADLRTKLVQLGMIFSLVLLTAGASRLARFNIVRNPQPSTPGRPGKKYFVGMPIPAGAAVIAAVVHFGGGEPVTSGWLAVAWAALLAAVAFLMVSTWRFVSFKGIDLRSRHPFRTIIFLGAVIAAIWFYSQFVLFVLALTYMLSGVLVRLIYALRRKAASPPPADEAQHKEAQTQE